MKKKNKAILIITILTVIIGLVFFLVGGSLSGWDIKGWFTSKWGYMTYIALGCWLIFALILFVPDWIKRL